VDKVIYIGYLAPQGQEPMENHHIVLKVKLKKV